MFELLGLKCGHMIEMMQQQSVDRKRMTSAISQSTKTAKQQRKKRVFKESCKKD